MIRHHVTIQTILNQSIRFNATDSELGHLLDHIGDKGYIGIPMKDGSMTYVNYSQIIYVTSREIKEDSECPS